MAGSPRAETSEIRHEIRTRLTAPSTVRAGPWGGADRLQTPDSLDHAVLGSFIKRLTSGPGKAWEFHEAFLLPSRADGP